MATTDEILRKYSTKIESQISEKKDYSKEYEAFKSEKIHFLSRYERWAQSLGNFVSLKISEKDKIKVEKNLKDAHVKVSPSQALALAITAMVMIFMLILLISVLILLVTDSFPAVLFLLGALTSIFAYYYTYTMPARLANSWRLKASSQMVPAILYIVVYMKHNSNL